MSSQGGAANNNYLLKQQITNLKKQASKRYNSNVRGHGNQSVLGQASAIASNAYGSTEPATKLSHHQLPSSNNQANISSEKVNDNSKGARNAQASQQRSSLSQGRGGVGSQNMTQQQQKAIQQSNNYYSSKQASNPGSQNMAPQRTNNKILHSSGNHTSGYGSKKGNNNSNSQVLQGSGVVDLRSSFQNQSSRMLASGPKGSNTRRSNHSLKQRLVGESPRNQSGTTRQAGRNSSNNNYQDYSSAANKSQPQVNLAKSSEVNRGQFQQTQNQKSLSRSQANLGKAGESQSERKTSLRMGTPTQKNQRNASQQAKQPQQVNTNTKNISSQDPFFVHRMSNSNSNLKHIIKSYKEDNSQQLSQVPGQQVVVQSPQIKQIPMTKKSKKQSLTNNGANLPPTDLGAPYQRLTQESSTTTGFQDYQQAFSQNNIPTSQNSTQSAAPLHHHHQQQQPNHQAPMRVQELNPATQTQIKKQLLEQSRQTNNNSVPLKYDQKLRSGSTPAVGQHTSFVQVRNNEISPEALIRQQNSSQNASKHPPHLNQSANKAAGGNNPSSSYAMNASKINSIKACNCACACQQQTSQTSHMISILSSSQQIHKNNTMTLIRGANARGGLSSIGPNTTIYGEESLVENGEIEELHYLSVKVERMKKAMLNRVEGLNQTEIKEQKSNATNLLIDDNDRREEMLYRSMDNIIETQTGGGDILNNQSTNHNNNVGETSNTNKLNNASQQALRRNSELNQYSEIAISDQKDSYGCGQQRQRVTNLDIQAIRQSNKQNQRGGQRNLILIEDE